MAVSAEKIHRSDPSKGSMKHLIVTQKNLYVVEEKSFAVKDTIEFDRIQGISVSPFGDHTLILSIQNSDKGDTIFSFRSADQFYDFCGKIIVVAKRYAQKTIGIQCLDSFQAMFLSKVVKVKYYAENNRQNISFKSGNDDFKIYVPK